MKSQVKTDKTKMFNNYKEKTVYNIHDGTEEDQEY